METQWPGEVRPFFLYLPTTANLGFAYSAPPIPSLLLVDFSPREIIVPLLEEAAMNPWTCAFLISVAGALGGVVNALLTDNGFLFPRTLRTVWCPGFISNVLIGAFAAFSSWALYGSGAGVELGALSERTEISLRFSALAGAFVIGIAGAKWITNEADKLMLKESVKVVSGAKLPPEDCDRLVQGSARRVLKRVQQV